MSITSENVSASNNHWNKRAFISSFFHSLPFEYIRYECLQRFVFNILTLLECVGFGVSGGCGQKKIGLPLRNRKKNNKI